MKSDLTVCGIYAIMNTVNGKKYIGSAANVSTRFWLHRKQLTTGVHHSVKLQRAWDKYGEAAFVWTLLETVSDASLLIQAEQRWIDSENSAGSGGYNVSPTAGSPLGVKHTDASRKNMSLAHMGKTHTEEHKAKISRAGLGRKMSPEAVAKRVATRHARGGYVQTEEALAKMVAARRQAGGFSHTEEARKVMSEAASRMWASRRAQQNTQPQEGATP